MAISIGNTYINGLIDAAVGPLDSIFTSHASDPTLKTALPAETEIRNKLSFANIYISFPTKGGNIPFLNFLPSNILVFPAYLSSFSDKFQVDASGQKYYGRTDPTPNYKGVTRNISVGLSIPCFNSKDANENMKKINAFVQNLYPTYNSFKGDLIMGSPPLVRVKFGNLITNQAKGYGGLLGYITSFDYSFDVNDGFYFSNDGSNSTNLFFKSYNLTFTFTVLHEGVVGNINGKESINRPFPYQTNTSRFNPAQILGGSGATAPISQDIAQQSQLGEN
jgi:hypothetical protein